MSARNVVNLWRPICVWVCVVSCHVAVSERLLAQGRDGGKFDGARWTFSMRPKTEGGQPVRGEFRLAYQAIYQKDGEGDDQFSKRVARCVTRGGETKISFKGLTAREKNGGKLVRIDGAALIRIERFGHWHGTLIDETGRHWDFRCTRVEE